MATDDPRMGTLLRSYSAEGVVDALANGLRAVVVVGFPHDEGVRRNGGRVGAAAAPAAFREFLPRLGTVVNPELGIDLRTAVALFDYGDVVCADLESSHAELRRVVGLLVAAGALPFVVGGGNDQSFPNAMGLIDGLKARSQVAVAPKVGVVNVDAHLDVRPLKEGRVHSGSPFRLMLESLEFRAGESSFVEFAAHGSQCSAEHAAFVLAHPRSSIVWLSKLLPTAPQAFQRTVLESFDRDAGVFLSFDLDAVVSDAAPGVSCPAAVGLSAEDAFAICRLSGADPRVALVDVSELNPLIEGYRTPRVVVFMLYNFLLGLAERPH